MIKKENMPTWVYWGLWGINSHKIAMTYFYVSVITCLSVIPICVMLNNYMLLSFSMAPAWYWLSIKWADDNGAWEVPLDSE